MITLEATPEDAVGNNADNGRDDGESSDVTDQNSVLSLSEYSRNRRIRCSGGFIYHGKRPLLIRMSQFKADYLTMHVEPDKNRRLPLNSSAEYVDRCVSQIIQHLIFFMFTY